MKASMTVLAAALLACAPTAANAAVTMSTVNSVLTITDSSSAPVDNSVVVTCAGGSSMLTVQVNGGATTTHGTCSSSHGIDITMNRGNDTVDTSGVVGLSLLRAAVISVQISADRSIFENTVEQNSFTGGPLREEVVTAAKDSNDSVSTAGGNDVIDAPADGSLNGGEGSDTVVIAGSTNLSATSLTRPCACFGVTEVPATNFERATITGTESADFLDAALFPGAATIDAHGGDDTILASPSGDIEGGDGTDTATLGGTSVTINFSTVTGDQPREAAHIEKFVWTGGTGDDTFDAAWSGAFVTASGGAGNDVIMASWAGSVLRGGDGEDVLTLGASGVDDAAGGPGVDTLKAWVEGTYTLTSTGDGTDAIVEMEAADIRGFAENDTIDTTAFPGPVTIDALTGNDTIRTGPAADRVLGGDGDDSFFGGPGNDTIDGGGGRDTMSYAGPIPVTVDLAGGRSGAADETDTLAGIDVAIGSNAADRMTGGAAAETLLGGDGPDRLDGGGGADLLDGGRGADFLTGGPGGAGDGDVLLGAAGFDVLSYAGRTRPVRVTLDGKPDDGEAGEGDQADPSNEVLVGGNADDILVGPQDFAAAGLAPNPQAAAAAPQRLRILSGGAGNDTVTGSPGRDMVAGGPGMDRLSGLAGNDAVQGGSGDDVLDAGAGNDRAYPKRGRDRVQLGAGADVAFTNDAAKDDVACGAGEDKVYSGAGDDEGVDCDSVSGTSKKEAPSAAGSDVDNTDSTLVDGDCPFGEEGADPASLCEQLLSGSASDFLELSEEGSSAFTDVEAGEWDELFYGLGYDDFGDGFGEDLGGKAPPAPALKTKRTRLAKNQFGVTVTCPKKADRRCIGELTAVLDAEKSDKAVASGLLGIPAGKSATVKLKVSAKSRKAVKKAKRLDITLEGRDRGDQLWQLTTSVKLDGSQSKKTKKKRR